MKSCVIVIIGRHYIFISSQIYKKRNFFQLYLNPPDWHFRVSVIHLHFATVIL